jgi:hypothetical protein
VKINSTTTASEIMTEFPELVDYLVELGICGCNDGYESDLSWSLEKIAVEKNMDLLELLKNLNNRVE